MHRIQLHGNHYQGFYTFANLLGRKGTTETGFWPKTIRYTIARGLRFVPRHFILTQMNQNRVTKI